MTPKRMLFRTYVRTLEALTMMRRPVNICHLPTQPLEHKQIDIITVAFNNAELIRLQELFLQKFITDKFTHIVVDNSTDKNVRKEIYAFCKKEGIAYIGLPKTLLNLVGGSYSHAMSINYVYRHIIRKRKPYAFGIIDHDIFPTKPISIFEKLYQQPIYGPLRHRDRWWYLSAIMSFFRFDFVENKKMDFMPVTPEKIYLDSGGGNWYDLYSHLDLSQLSFPDEEIVPLREGGDRHADSLEYFDHRHWLHTINGSCWKPIPEEAEKATLIRKLLNSILQS